MTLRAAALAVLLLAGCGGATNSYDLNTMQGIRDALAAKQLPCEGYQQRTEVLFAKEDGSCTIHGEKVNITLYQSVEQRNGVNEAFKSLRSGYHVDGQQPWTIGTNSSDLANKVAAALGGKVA